MSGNRSAGIGSAIALSAFLFCCARYAAAGESLGDLTGPWQLLVDDSLVASKSGVVRTYHAFQKYAGNPVITATEPWEDSIVYIYGTVLPEENGTGLRMWYHTLRPEDTNNDGSNILYATSTDGVYWTKPNLGIRSWHGSAANNMIFVRPGQSGITSVMHTPWDPDPAARYKLMNFDIGGYWGAWSSDGVHTVDVPNNPVLTGGGDVGQFTWDPHTQKYLAYVKLNSYVRGLKRRSLGFCATTDIQSWPPLELILEPDDIDDRWVPAGTVQRTHIYGLAAFAYESAYLGFLWIFRATDAEGYYIGPVYTELVSSRDGIHWIREEGDRPAILPLGPAGAWDDGQLYTAIAPVIKNGNVVIYYGACDGVHGTSAKLLTCAIGMATLRKDGFASLDAGASIGTLTTKGLIGVSGTLHVNCTTAGGWLKVEVLDAAGQVVPGYSEADCVSVQGSGIDQAVMWSAQTQLPTGIGTLRLRFVLQNASLYSFMAGDGVEIVDVPTLIRQPLDQTIATGGTATFSIQAIGPGPLTYRWYRNDAPIDNNDHIAGADTDILTISNAVFSDAALYSCVVMNPYGSVKSNQARLTLLTAHLVGIGQLVKDAGSIVGGMTADGSVVCGTSSGRAVLWTRSGGMKDLGVPADATSSAAVGIGIYNGQVVVAVNTDAATFKAKRWNGDTLGLGTFSSLPRMNGTLEWRITGLGTNGSTDLWIAGSSLTGGDGDGRQAGRYRQGTNTTDLYGLPFDGHDHSDFHAVSDTGFFGGQYQYRGIAPGGGARNAMKSIGTTSCMPLNTLLGLPNTKYEAVVKALSRNGLVQGGWSYYVNGGAYHQPVIWNNLDNPTLVPFISGDDNDNDGEVLALSGDGALAGGYSRYRADTSPDGPIEAFLWDATHGTRRLQEMLTVQYGMDLAVWSLQEVRCLSSDGQVIAGNGLHDGISEGWVVVFAESQPRTPADLDGDGDVDIDDFNLFMPCVTGPALGPVSNACSPIDFDLDNDVDQSDFGRFQRCYSGSGHSASLDCAE